MEVLVTLERNTMRNLKKLLTVSIIAFAGTTSIAEPSAPSPVVNAELDNFNSVSIVGPINEELSSDFIADLLHHDGNSVFIYLDSPGGSIIAGNQMIAAMRSSGKRTKCIARFAASMAFIILQACDERYITSDGVLMQHVASYGLRGQAPNNVSFVGFLETMIKHLDKAQAARIGLSYEDFKRVTRDDWWLYSGDAISAKTADGFADVTCSSKLIKGERIKEFRTFFGNIKVRMSTCPLITKLEVIKKVGTTSIDSFNLNSFKTPDMIKQLNGVHNE